MDCLFCKFASGDIPVEFVHESEDFFAIKDINPKAPIHILIITKAHFSNVSEVSGSVMAGLPLFVKELVGKLGISDSGYRVITNIGKDGGQEIDHLHFHLLGGKSLGGLVC